MQDMNHLAERVAQPPRARGDLAVYELDDELVVHDPDNGQSYVLNATGRVIWSLCDGERTCGAIAEELSVAFGVDTAVVLPDVVALVDDLRQACLLNDDPSHEFSDAERS